MEHQPTSSEQRLQGLAAGDLNVIEDAPGSYVKVRAA